MQHFSAAIPDFNPWLFDLIRILGNSGVNLFFVISGFIITTLLFNEKRTKGKVSLTAFYIRRFFRIIPPLAVYIITILVLFKLNVIRLLLKNVLWSVLFMGNLNLIKNPADWQGWFTTHTWSLSDNAGNYKK